MGGGHTFANTQQHQTSSQTSRASSNKPSRSVLVKDRSDVNPQKERQEGIETEDPSDSRGIIIRQLMRRDIGLESSQDIHQPQSREQRQPTPQDDKPCPLTALGVGLLILGVRRCGCIGVLSRVRVRAVRIVSIGDTPGHERDTGPGFFEGFGFLVPAVPYARCDGVMDRHNRRLNDLRWPLLSLHLSRNLEHDRERVYNNCHRHNMLFFTNGKDFVY
jgi:hypothetical protein